MKRRNLLTAAIASAFASKAITAFARTANTPALMLADVYRAGMSLDDYWVSEKYDGVRGYWDGAQLWTRGGERVVAPAWFTAAMPKRALDGELWAGRGRFTDAMSTVRSQTPDDKAWHDVRFMVFDLPGEPGDFTQRLAALRKLLPVPDAPWVVPVAQQRATTHAELKTLLDKTVKLGGEGLMLHRGASLYKGERNADLLKVKPHDDAEAKVVGHVAGRGKHDGRMGALVVEMPDGQRFKLGGGFTDAQREKPPAIGSYVTYRYNGTNPGGLPRFARFLRLREDAERS